MSSRLSAGDAVSRTNSPKDGAGTLVLNGSVQVLVAANKDRVELVITNNGAAACFIGFGKDPAVNRGARLNAAGGSLVTNAFTGEVRVIGTTSDVVSFIEV